MKIKHSKYRNTGLIFELLVKQIAADTLSRQESPAVRIMKKYFTGKASLVREFKLYKYILENKGVSQMKGETILSTITEVSRKINRTAVKKQKYDLIAAIKESYDLDEFFSMKVRDYKPLAALYCLMEAQTTDLVDPQFIVNNKTTILEHLTSSKQSEKDVKDTIVEEYSKYDKDLRLLTYKILLEKFNGIYSNFLPEQKTILREFINASESQVKLRSLINEELEKISSAVNELKERVSDDIAKIKLDEVSKNITPISNKSKVGDSHIINLLQYYELVNELRSL
tara:strand:+ start:1949 stop:2800 length:852 start_codon:yes stop_codon:yes gene_type:complete